MFNSSSPSPHLGQDPSGDQKSRAVGGGVVRQPDLDAVFGEFVSVSGLNDHVSINTGVRYLADDVLVCHADDQSTSEEWREKRRKSDARLKDD